MGEGEAPRQDPIEQVQQNNNKPIEALQQMHLSPDMQNKINQDPELAQQINQTIEQLLSQATSEVGDQQPMQEALQKFLTSQENQKLKPEHIIAGLQALTSMTRDTKMGSLYDHATTVAQEKYHLALSTQAKIDEKQNILANQKEIGQEIDESIANQKEIGQEIDESIANQKEIGQEIKEMIKIAKQKADLIH
ncbi:MAG: hypothetical protein H6766_07890 [Candidatus Peribacteria bacterium]|nr:MAG: hypothetical protein H6766_07890 [Candidatus Peribacteria bacterium]